MYVYFMIIAVLEACTVKTVFAQSGVFSDPVTYMLIYIHVHSVQVCVCTSGFYMRACMPMHTHVDVHVHMFT